MNSHSSILFFQNLAYLADGNVWEKGVGVGGNQSLQFYYFYHQRLLKGHANQLHLYCQVRMHDIFFHLALAEQV